MLDLIDLTTSVKVDEYWRVMEDLLNVNTDNLLRMAFNIYDIGQDRKVDATDLFCLVKIFQKEDDLFFQAFSQDLLVISHAIAVKTKDSGMEDIEVNLKLAAVDKRLQAFAGGSLNS